MARPRGAPNRLHERRPEWMLVRQTAMLGDVIDEATFVEMLKVNRKSFRNRVTAGDWYGVEIPRPIYRPDGMKPIWLKSEAEEFARLFQAKRVTRER